MSNNNNQPPPPPPANLGAMPGRSSSSAPKFDGKPQSLMRFLNEVNALATEKGLTEEHTIKATLSYVPSQDYDAWNDLPEATGAVWADFVKAVCAIYPGAERGDRRFVRADLDALAERTARAPMTDQAQFGEYYRSFLTIYTFLKNKGRITTYDASTKFLDGLPVVLRTDVVRYLRANAPGHHADDGWAIKTLYDAVLFVLSERPVDRNAHQFAAPVHPQDNAVIKKEVFDATSITRYLESDAFLNKIKSVVVGTLQSAPQQQGSSYQANRFTPKYDPRQNGPPGAYMANTNAAVSGPTSFRPDTCVFCSDPGHYQSECAQAQEYIRRGLCERNERMQIVLPGGFRISSRFLPGANLKERVDYWHHTNPSAGAITTAASNMVQVSVPQLESNNPWSAYLQQVNNSHDDTIKEEPCMSVREVEKLALLNRVAAATQRKIEEISSFGPTTRARSYDTPQAPSSNKKSGNAMTNKPTSSPLVHDTPPHMPAPPPPAPVQEIAPTVVAKQARAPTPPSGTSSTATSVTSRNPFNTVAPPPQFTYHTPVESNKVAQELLELSMNAPITITNRQLLAVSGDVRKGMRDQIATRRVPHTEATGSSMLLETPRTQTVESYLAMLPERTDDLIVANHVEDLRAISVDIPGVSNVEAIMDEGCQVIAMSADVWSKTNLPIRSDHILSMQAANAENNDTMGLLHNLPIRIGGYEFLVQCQVVQGAPYEMLIGRPFMTLTQASTRHFTNGDSHLTLVDPNTQAVITLPTHARIREEKGEPAVEGFQQ